jgi:hypothetical protein
MGRWYWDRHRYCLCPSNFFVVGVYKLFFLELLGPFIRLSLLLGKQLTQALGKARTIIHNYI